MLVKIMQNLVKFFHTLIWHCPVVPGPSCCVNSCVCYYICTLLTETFPSKHQVDLAGIVVISSCQ